MDIGERYTEAQMKQIERRLKSIYKEAEQDVGRKLREFNKAHKERDAKYRAAVKAGEMSKEDYQAWLRGQVFQGEQWKARRKQMAESLTHANEQAMAIVNGTRFNVFAENANFIEYEIGMGAGLAGAQFGLYDARTVKRLVADDPKLLPPSKVSYPKDMAWNMKKINNALTQGIIQGEAIDDIAQRMANVTGSSRKAMVLHARTSMTGAQNAGRLEGMRAAERLGLKVKKQWMATLDNRTRDSHQDLDGQVQDIDKPFDSILGPIMHPGDPTADPANVYNCRCTLIYVFDDEEFSGERRDEEADEDIEYKTYQEWKTGQKHEEVQAEAPTIAGVEQGKPMAHEQADSGNVNPHFGEAVGYSINCQSCVVTYEARRRGYDVEVVPNDKSHPNCEALSRDTLRAYKDPATGEKPQYLYNSRFTLSSLWTDEVPNAKRFEKRLQEDIQEGGRYELGFAWKGARNSGHIVMLGKDKQGLFIYDPQCDERYTGAQFSHYLTRIKYTVTSYGYKYYTWPEVLRVDDKEFDIDFIEGVLKKK